MNKLIVKMNLSSADKASYFSSQWKHHYQSQGSSVLTDMIMIGTKDDHQTEAVPAHQAVLMNLCPLLADMSKDVSKEDPVFLFPDDSVQVIRAFIKFMYQGFFEITANVSFDDVMNFMLRIGLVLPPGSFAVERMQTLPTLTSQLSQRLEDQERAEPCQERMIQEKPDRCVNDDDVNNELPQSSSVPENPIADEESNNNDGEKNEDVDDGNNEELQKKDKGMMSRLRKKRILKKQDNVVNEKMKPDQSDPAQVVESNKSKKRKPQVRISLPQKKILDVCREPDQQDNHSSTASSGMRTRRRSKRFDWDDFEADIGLLTNANAGDKNVKVEEFVEDKEDNQEPEASEEETVRKRKPKATSQKCMLCSFSCKFAKDLVTHCDEVHTDDEFQCPSCHFTSTSYIKLRNHQYNKKHYQAEDSATKTPDMSSKIEEEDDDLTSPSLKTKETSQESFKGRISGVNGVKRKLSFASSEVDNNDINETDREDPSDVDIGSIYSILQEMGEGDQKDRDGEENITKDVVSKNDSSSMVLNDQARDGPSYKVGCSVDACETVFPVIKKHDSDTAAEKMIHHQKTVHKLKESEMSYQILLDNVNDVIAEDVVDQDDEDPPLQFADEVERINWRSKLISAWETMVSSHQEFSNVDIIFVQLKADTGFSFSCRLGKLIISGHGDTEDTARESAAQNMFVLLKETINLKDDDIIKKNILGDD